MIYGIQASKDVKLSNISRVLNEKIAFIKTENRLSRNAKSCDLTEDINRGMIREGASRIKEDTVLSIDPGDIDKPYAKEMEHLALVRDGSTGENKSNGYWLLNIVGADIDGDKVIPLYGELYSQKAEEFKSENNQMLNAIDIVMGGTGQRGIWTIDRGGDRTVIIKGLFDRSLRFVLRMTGKRNLILKDGKEKRSLMIAWDCECPIQKEVTTEKGGEIKKRVISIGYKGVKLPFYEEWLWMVVIKGFGEKPMMLLTNVDVKKTGVERILEIYLTRWKCEESYRFIKQSYNLEDVRVLSYTALRNIVVLVQAVFYFVSVELGTKMKLSILVKKVVEKAKRFFEIPVFYQYALADGIYKILFAAKGQFIPNITRKENPGQIPLPLSMQIA